MDYVRFFLGTPRRLTATVVVISFIAIIIFPGLQAMIEQGLNRIIYLLFNYVLWIAIMIFAVVMIVRAPFRRGGRR